jgi:exportin-2 (importin alpha re-exporter)
VLLCLLQEPLLLLFKQAGVELRTPGVAKEQQVLIVGALRIMARIFFSLNWQDLPEYFEDHIQEWMTEFLSYFSYNNPALVDNDNEDEPDPIDALLVGIAENVNLYADKYDEEFKPFLNEFTRVSEPSTAYILPELANPICVIGLLELPREQSDVAAQAR